MKNYKLIPRISLWILLALSVVFTVMFFVGGSNGSLEVAGDFLDIPRFTDLLLEWTYVLFGLACIVTLGVVVWEFIKNCKYDHRKAISTIVVVLGFAILIVVCWFLGSPEKIDIIGYEGTENVGTWAQITDAILYLTYILFGATVVTLIWGFIHTKIRNKG